MTAPITPVGAVVAQWIFWLVAFTFVALRMWVRWHLQNRISLSDGFIIMAMVCMTYSHCADTVLEVWVFMNPAPPPSAAPTASSNATNSVGGNTTSSAVSTSVLNLSVEQIQQLHRTIIAFKMIYFSVPAYYSTTWCIKAAFILFYYQLFPPRMRKLRIALHCTAFLVFTGWIVILFMNFFWCLPVSRNWDYAHPENVCLSYDSHKPYYTTVGFHLLTDALIYALPFFLLPYLSLSFRKKLSLSFIFGLGLLCILVAVGRIVAIGVGGDLSVATVLSAVEQATAVVVACCPPLKWLYTSYKSSYRGSSVTSIEEGAGTPGEESDTRVEFGTVRLSRRSRKTERSSTGTGLGTLRGREKDEIGAGDKPLGDVKEEQEASMSPPPNRNAISSPIDIESGVKDVRPLDLNMDNRVQGDGVEVQPANEHELGSEKPTDETQPGGLTSPYKRRSRDA